MSFKDFKFKCEKHKPSAAWISSPRFSRDGRRIAFLHHPSPGDDRGQVGLVDLTGDSRMLTEPYSSAPVPNRSTVSGATQ